MHVLLTKFWPGAMAFGLGLLLMFGGQLPAQDAEMVQSAVSDALRQYLVDKYPDQNCEDNDALHNYTGQIKFTKRQVVSGVLRVWGLATVYHKSRFHGGKGYVEFYAELVKEAGFPTVVKLKWRKNDCMRFEVLMET